MPSSTPQARRLPLDFDEGVRLAKTDPEGFELRRKAIIEEFIGAAPEHHRQRLRRLQWRIDMERRRAPNPMAACVRVYQMMWESFAGDGGLVETLRHPERQRPRRRASVIPFPAPAPRHN